MKEKIFGVFAALIILAAAHNLWFSYKGKITFSTDSKPGTEIFFEYNKENHLYSEKKKVSSDGKVSFAVKGKTLAWFKINVSKEKMIKKTHFRGWKKQDIILTDQNEYVGKALRNRISINCYNLIVLGSLGYYLGWFLINSLKYGFPKDDSKPPKMMNIEFLRIVFTFVVLFFHISGYFKYFSLGRYGVEFFFILSGFFFALTYGRCSSVYDFMKKRIIRFAPIIVFCSVICGIFKSGINFSTLSADWFFFGNTLFNGDSYTGAAWYISVLFWITALYFYLLKTQRKETVYVIIAVLTFFGYAASSRFGWGRFGGLGNKENIGYIITQSLTRGLGGIGLGFFIALFYLNRKQDKNLFKPWQYTIAEICFLIFPCICMFNEKIFPSSIMMLIVCYAFLLYLFVVQKGYVSRFFEKPVFAKISRYVLAVYISHQSVGIPILRSFKILPSSFSSNLMGIAVYIAFFCLIGFIIHHTVELPATRALKKWLE
ncbi:MAG: acyltransferase [Alphaproteobacteria bacterium]|nr:acyltransferase [Alphaproteobacteria bacterium]